MVVRLLVRASVIALVATLVTVGGAAASGRDPGLPNPVATPGATNPRVTPATIHSTICVSGYSSSVRPPESYTEKLKYHQLDTGYNLRGDTRASDYEEDHLISLELGGAPKDPLNLWPEPYVVTLTDGTLVGAHQKDQVENYLHRQVCLGAMTLRAAQQAIATDWEGVWRSAGLNKLPAPTSSTS